MPGSSQPRPVARPAARVGHPARRSKPTDCVRGSSLNPHLTYYQSNPYDPTERQAVIGGGRFNRRTSHAGPGPPAARVLASVRPRCHQHPAPQPPGHAESTVAHPPDPTAVDAQAASKPDAGQPTPVVRCRPKDRANARRTAGARDAQRPTPEPVPRTSPPTRAAANSTRSSSALSSPPISADVNTHDSATNPGHQTTPANRTVRVFRLTERLCQPFHPRVKPTRDNKRSDRLPTEDPCPPRAPSLPSVRHADHHRFIPVEQR